VPFGDRVKIGCHLGLFKKDLLFFEFLFAFTEICVVFSKTISDGRRVHRNAANKGKKGAVVYLDREK
jgi:hypothetical protein